MSAKQIFMLIIAIIVGVVAVKLVFWLLGAVWTIASWLLTIAVVGVVAYIAYRGFNNMLSSGKRLTS